MTTLPIRVAITSEGPLLSDALDTRFGRAGGFVLIDLETMATTYVDNGSAQVLAQGAGIRAVENLVAAGAQILLTGHVGPKAFTALKAVGVKVVQGLEDLTVGKALNLLTSGQLAFSDAPGE
jgi:predicted Fe-Mo cluster-binding NifX family protein